MENGDIFACGKNAEGQLGFNRFVQIETPLRLPTEKLFTEPLVQIACGQSHTLFLTRSGRIYGAGEVHVNQLGPRCSSNTSSATELVILSDPTFCFLHIACGYNFSYFYGNDGAIYCCGSNQVGQLGDAEIGPTGLKEMEPLDFGVAGSDWDREVRFAAGDCHVIIYKPVIQRWHTWKGPQRSFPRLFMALQNASLSDIIILT
jgi:hypothetical protein